MGETTSFSWLHASSTQVYDLCNNKEQKKLQVSFPPLISHSYRKRKARYLEWQMQIMLTHTFPGLGPGC